MPDYTRPPAFPFSFGGVNLRNSPETIPPIQYASACNVRGDSLTSLRTRPGYLLSFSATAARSILSIRAYSTLGTDNLPRILAYDDQGHIILDTGTTLATLSGTVSPGACMVPFRPNASPQSWMYVSVLADYKKFSAPDATNSVTVAKVGVAEPPAQLEYAPNPPVYKDISSNAAGWTPAGTAGATADATRTTDTVTAIFADPALSTRYSVQIATAAPIAYQIGELLNFATNQQGSIQALVQDVLPPIATGAGLTIKAIRYAAGVSGRCTIVPSRLPIGQSQPTTAQIGMLRRGALIKLKATEVVLVLSATSGPDGSQSFECVTSGTFAAGDALDGIVAIVVDGINATVVGQTVSSALVSSAVTTGLATLTQSLATNPFATELYLNNVTASGRLPQRDDYIHLSVNISDYSLLTELKIIFNTNPAGGTDYQNNALYYAVSPSVLATVAKSTETQAAAVAAATQLDTIQARLQDIQSQIEALGPQPEGGENPAYWTSLAQLKDQYETLSNQNQYNLNTIESVGGLTIAGLAQWTEILFPISSLTPIGGDQTRTLADCNGVRVSVIATGAITVKLSSFWVGGGGQPDTGDSNADYRYIAVPRAASGATGNPVPLPRYGVRSRRQPIIITLPSAAYDTQIAYWDLYRYGGTITSWRYIGTALSSASTFTDNYFDSAANAGKPVEFDNYEPWPSIDVPYSVSSDGGTTITVTGTFVVISGPTVWPATILRWLPGTLITLDGQRTYTLRARPTLLSATSYLFELVECANYGAATSFTVNEPVVARQPAPYMWGPNEQGDIFAVGDSLRPGTLYFCKSNNPDSAPDSFNTELCPPSEPLIGGEILKGVSLVASTRRWWALYPSFSYTSIAAGASQSRYTPIEQSVGRPLISPYAMCTDGQTLYFWTTDCIAMTAGGPYKSLTDEALYPLFPHEGVTPVSITRNGITYYAPDYSRSAQFRLSVANKYLYADYVDSNGTHHTLVLNLLTGAWCADEYANSITLHYSLEQQVGTLGTGSPALHSKLWLADTSGNVWVQSDLHNDNLTYITCTLATFEWDGADQRGNDLWGDMYLVSVPVSAITATPTYLGASIAGVSATTIPASASRAFSPISMAGGKLLNYLGLTLSWFDDFLKVSASTTLYFWQPSLIQQVETTLDRSGDWDNSNVLGNKFYQGVVIDGDTFNVAKSVEIRDADTLTLHALQPATVQHNGRTTKAYTFATPFTAHSVRDEPQDLVPWRKFKLEYVFEPTPESGETWETQFTAHGLTGFHHIGRVEAAYSALSDVTLTITAFDGTSPTALTLPATVGVYHKLLLFPTFNKGQLYKYGAKSAQPFQIYLNDWVVWIGQWARQSAYLPYRLLGGEFGDRARV